MRGILYNKSVVRIIEQMIIFRETVEVFVKDRSITLVATVQEIVTWLNVRSNKTLYD